MPGPAPGHGCYCAARFCGGSSGPCCGSCSGCSADGCGPCCDCDCGGHDYGFGCSGYGYEIGCAVAGGCVTSAYELGTCCVICAGGPEIGCVAFWTGCAICDAGCARCVCYQNGAG